MSDIAVVPLSILGNHYNINTMLFIIQRPHLDFTNSPAYFVQGPSGRAHCVCCHSSLLSSSLWQLLILALSFRILITLKSYFVDCLSICLKFSCNSIKVVHFCEYYNRNYGFPSSVQPTRVSAMSTCAIIAGVNFDHLVKVPPLKSDDLFPLRLIRVLWRDSLRLLWISFFTSYFAH